MKRELIVSMLTQREKILDGCISRLNEISCLFLPEVVEGCFDLSDGTTAKEIIAANQKMISEVTEQIFMFKSQNVTAPKMAFLAGSDKTYFPFIALDRNIEYAESCVVRLEEQTKAMKDYYNFVVRAGGASQKGEPGNFGYLN